MKKTVEKQLQTWLTSPNQPQLQIYLDHRGNWLASQAGNPAYTGAGKTLEEAVISFLKTTQNGHES